MPKLPPTQLAQRTGYDLIHRIRERN